MIPRLAAVAVVVLVAAACLAKDADPQRLPAEVRRAQQPILSWLDGLAGKDMQQVEQMLGEPSERRNWEFEGQRQPLLKYAYGERSELNVFFHDAKVVTASLQLISN